MTADTAAPAQGAALAPDALEKKREELIENTPLFPNRGKPPRAKPSRSIAVIDQNGCTGCEVCIDFCPVDCIEIAPGLEKDGLFNVVEVDMDRCIGCTLCAKNCPWETIYMIRDTEVLETARETTVRSVMYGWGKEKYPGQEEYYEMLEAAKEAQG
jgi:formate hydrogenlyase subunit 6/NADH:ubiquinone oxidoreductase subunit I